MVQSFTQVNGEFDLDQAPPRDDPQATVTQRPVSPGRARHRPLKPLRSECRCFGFACRCLCAFSNRTQGCGAAKTPGIPRALSCFEGGSHITRARLRYGNAGVRPLGCWTIESEMPVKPRWDAGMDFSASSWPGLSWLVPAIPRPGSWREARGCPG